MRLCPYGKKLIGYAVTAVFLFLSAACRQSPSPPVVTATDIPIERHTPVWLAEFAPPTVAVTSTVPAAAGEEIEAVATSPSPVATATASPTPDRRVQTPYIGMWLSRRELARLPTSGPAWESLQAAADQPVGEPDLSDQDQKNDVYVLAKALVYARTGERRYRDEVVDNIMAAIGTEAGGRTLALARSLPAYILSADLINLPQDPEQDEAFRAWLGELLTKKLDGRTLQSTHEIRPNNWGTHAGAARAAIAIYLNDEAELDRTARVFKGWLGDREAYDGFEYGRLSWQADPDNPVGINRAGATKEGYSIDGALPEEMRRGGNFRWPPKETVYAWEALQGALVQAYLLNRAGYDTWDWEDQALLRAVQFLYDIDWPAEGDDLWQPWLVNYAYGTTFPTTTPTNPGKNVGWTDWSHQPLIVPNGN